MTREPVRPWWVAQTLGQIVSLLERGEIEEAWGVAYCALHAVDDDTRCGRCSR